MQRFTELAVWRRAHLLALDVYRLTAFFPEEERYGLTGQLRRAAVSVPSNIAEGARRRFRNDFARFLNIAEGSTAELEALFLICSEAGLGPAEQCERLRNEAHVISCMLIALRTKVESHGEPAGSRPREQNSQSSRG